MPLTPEKSEPKVGIHAASVSWGGSCVEEVTSSAF